jgi:hypothetical protein
LGFFHATPIALVRPPQTAIGRCLRTATNWDFAVERARPGSRFRRRAVVGMARCAVRLPALSCPRRAGRNSAGQQRESASGDIAAQCQQASMPTMAMGKIKMQTVILDFEDSVIFQWQTAAQNEREVEEEFGFHGFLRVLSTKVWWFTGLW